MANPSVSIMYSVYGTDVNLYYKPVIQNIEFAKIHQYNIVISTTTKYIELVEEYFADYAEQVSIISYDEAIYNGREKLLRFLSVNQIQSNFYFFKDSDSVITKQEIDIMNNWMFTSSYNAMVIRNHSLHVYPILAGMFGIKSSLKLFISTSVQNAINSRVFKNKYSYDQQWLMLAVYPQIQKTIMVYTSFLFFSGEKYVQIGFDQKDYIGRPKDDTDIFNPFFTEAVLNRLYSFPFLHGLHNSLKLIIYGRVRPTMLILRFKEKLFNVF